MALVVNDRVKETTATTGTGTLDLAGAVQDFEGFVAGIGNSNTTYYAIVNTGTGEFEVGLGTVTDAATDTLSRDTIISSSNSDAAVNFSAGTKDVFCTLPASKAVVEDENNDVTLPADLTIGANLDVSSGTIKLDGNFPTGTNNVAMGDTALDSLTNGDDNTVIGDGAGTAVTTGQQNTVVGSTALNTGNATGNTAIGFRALRRATGANNTAIGRTAGDDTTTGAQNTFVGGSAGYYINGTNNVAVGYQAGNGLGNTGSSNVFMGYRAGNNNTTGSNNIVIGTSANASSATATNEITLGDTNVTSLRIPGLASGASSGDVLTYDGTDITLSTPSTGVTPAFVIAMSIAL